MSGPDNAFIGEAQAGQGGLRLAVKDLIDVAGQVTTAGCRALADTARAATEDAACLSAVRAGIRAGAVQIVGRTNLHELAYGITGINPWFGTPRNPLDPGRIPGGSSSGSAVAVATGAAEVALGTDTGGSVRIPAACCAVAGLKTTWGRVPLAGVRPLAPSLDTVGLLAADVTGLVAGMRLLEPGFEVAALPDDLVVHRLRLGDGMVEDAVDAALRRLAVPVTDADSRLADAWRAAYGAADDLLSAEALRSNRDLVAAHPEGVGLQVADRVRRGAAVTAVREAAARRAQSAWQDLLGRWVSSRSLLALPTLPGEVPQLSDGTFPRGNALTLPVNLAGLPAVSLPGTAPRGIPASLQLVGPPMGEELLLAVASLG